MKTDNGIAIAFFAVVLGGAVALAIANDITAPLCDAAKIKSMAPDKIEFGCLEFWLNRYQTTLQTIISGGIGAAGLYFVLKQLAALGQQNEMTRAALEATRRQHDAAERGLRGKARVALGAFSSACIALFHEAIIAGDPTQNRSTQINYEPFQKASAMLGEIAPALDTIELRAEWTVLQEEYNRLFAYIGSCRSGVPLDKVQQAFVDHTQMPANLADAAKRAWGLSTIIGKLSVKLDR